MPLVPVDPESVRRDGPWLRPVQRPPRIVYAYLAAALLIAVAESALWWPHASGLGYVAWSLFTLWINLLFIDLLMRRSRFAWGILLFVQIIFIPFELVYEPPLLHFLLASDAVKSVILLSPPMLRWIWIGPPPPHRG